MIPVAVILGLIAIIALKSETHALGLWIFLIIMHAVLVEVLGESVAIVPNLAGVLLMGILVARGKWNNLPAQIWVLISCLVGFMALAAMFGMDPPGSTVQLIVYCKGFAFALFVGGVLKDEEQIGKVAVYCITAVLIGACIAIYQHFAGTYSIDVYDVQRAGGLSKDPNETALLLGAGVPFVIYWLTRADQMTIKSLFFVILILIFGAITLTGSRGGGVTLLLILFLFFLKRPTFKVFLVGLVVMLVGLTFAAGEFIDRMETLSASGMSTDDSLDMRYQFVVEGIEIFIHHPALGVGMGNYGRALVAFNPNWGEEGVQHVSHNMYLDFFVENGVFAGILFVLFLVAAVAYALRYDKSMVRKDASYGIGFSTAMSLLALMIASAFLSEGTSSTLWFFVGLCLAFANLSRRRLPSS